MKKLWAVVVWMMLMTSVVRAANLCTLTGNLTLINGNAGAGSSITFTKARGMGSPPQNVGGTIVPFSSFTVYADGGGNVPANTKLPYSAVASVQICALNNGTFECDQPFVIQVPDQTQADLTTLFLAQNDPPSLCSSIACTGCTSVVNPPAGSIGVCSITVPTSGGGGGGGSSFPLTSNVSAAGFEIQNLGPDALQGDALSRLQSTMNSLATPTSAVSMGSQRLTTLGEPTTGGDALSEGRCVGCTVPAPVDGSVIQSTGHAYQGVAQTLAEASGVLAPTHPDLAAGGPDVVITIADNNNFTIANATGTSSVTTLAEHWWIRIVNNVGGAAGTITMGANYRTDASWGAPGNGKTRICPVLTKNNGSTAISYIGPCTADETN